MFNYRYTTLPVRHVRGWWLKRALLVLILSIFEGFSAEIETLNAGIGVFRVVNCIKDYIA